MLKLNLLLNYMSDNLINNSDLSSDSIEPFDSKLSGYYGNLERRKRWRNN